VTKLLRPGGLLSFPRTGCALRASRILARRGWLKIGVTGKSEEFGRPLTPKSKCRQ